MNGVLHKGLLEVCKVCRPDFKERDKKDKYFRPRHTGVVSADVAVRRALDAESGPDGLRPEQSAALAMKYGVAPTRLDRKVNRRNWRKPYWIGETEWKRRQREWLNWTKGLIPQFRPTGTNRDPRPGHNPQSLRDTRAYPRNYGPTRTGTPRNSRPN